MIYFLMENYQYLAIIIMFGLIVFIGLTIPGIEIVFGVGFP